MNPLNSTSHLHGRWRPWVYGCCVALALSWGLQFGLQGIGDSLLRGEEVLLKDSPQEEEDEDDLPQRGKMGLVVEYQQAGRRITRIENRPAFYFTTSQSPHPFLIPGQSYSSQWRGTLFVTRPGRYRFRAELSGEVKLSLNGQTLLEGKSSAGEKVELSASVPLELEFGPARLELEYHREAEQPARLRIFQQREGDLFEEPLPVGELEHDAKLENEQLVHWRGVEHGEMLFQRHRCSGCHLDSSQAEAGTTSPPTLNAPLLDGIGSRVRREWLLQWLTHPRSLRDDATMPDLFSETKEDQTDLQAAAWYLSSLQISEDETQQSLGGALTSDEKKKARELFALRGCAACHRTPQESKVATSVRSLVLSEELLVPLGHLGDKATAAEVFRRISKPREFYPGSRMPEWHGTEQFPEDWRLLARWLSEEIRLTLEPEEQVPGEQEVLGRLEALIGKEAVQKLSKENKIEQRKILGRTVLQTRGCLNCHSLKESGAGNKSFPSSSEILARSQKPDLSGCLSDKLHSDTKKTLRVDYSLSGEQRMALKGFLQESQAAKREKSLATQSEAVTPLYSLPRMLSRLGCVNCHAREGREAAYSRRYADFLPLATDQTPRDVAGPDLSGVGEKLLPNVLQDVLTERTRARPWLELKMPRFDSAAGKLLSDGLIAAEGLDPNEKEEPLFLDDESLRPAGRELVGRTGMNCVSCHDFAGHKSTGVRGPDLATASARLRQEWFRRWMLEPQRIAPGTRMPTVFFGGQSAAPKILGGKPDAQMGALWGYLAHTGDYPLPLFQPPLGDPLAGGESPRGVFEDRPLLFRGFMPEVAGMKAIVLGFPAGTHFAFDSQTCRLRAAWYGEFVEQGGWFGSGRESPEQEGLKILGRVFWRGTDQSLLAWEPVAHNPDASKRQKISSQLERIFPNDVRFAAAWALPEDAGFEYRLGFQQNDSSEKISTRTWLTVTERPRPIIPLEVLGEGEHGLERDIAVRGMKHDGYLWIRMGTFPVGAFRAEFFDAEGNLLGKEQKPEERFPCKLYPWARISLGGERLWIQASEAPQESLWQWSEEKQSTVEKPKDTQEKEKAAVEPSDSLSQVLWLRVPISSGESELVPKSETDQEASVRVVGRWVLAPEENDDVPRRLGKKFPSSKAESK